MERFSLFDLPIARRHGFLRLNYRHQARRAIRLEIKQDFAGLAVPRPCGSAHMRARLDRAGGTPAAEKRKACRVEAVDLGKASPIATNSQVVTWRSGLTAEKRLGAKRANVPTRLQGWAMIGGDQRQR